MTAARTFIMERHRFKSRGLASARAPITRTHYAHTHTHLHTNVTNTAFTSFKFFSLATTRYTITHTYPYIHVDKTCMTSNASRALFIISKSVPVPAHISSAPMKITFWNIFQADSGKAKRISFGTVLTALKTCQNPPESTILKNAVWHQKESALGDV